MKDVYVLCAGTLVSVAFVGAMMAAGDIRGWHAPNAIELDKHDGRFISKPDDPIASVAWYFWKLPPDQVTLLTRSTVWILYGLHQMAAWMILYLMQRENPTYSSNMRYYNWLALALNSFFHLVHFIQTHTLYDALAQDTPIASSQGSVVLLLCFIFIIEYSSRGAIAAYPELSETKKQEFNSFAHLLRKYHGYMFSWAAIYTFWYHPMESTLGHALGFVHTSLIMLQGSLAYTKVHLNKIWIVVLEAFVTIHAGVIAYQTSAGTDRLWPMFLFGFLFNFMFNQIYDIGTKTWRKMSVVVRVIPIVMYVGAALFTFSTVVKGRDGKPQLSRLNETIRIPVIDVLFCLIIYGCTFIVNALYNRMLPWKIWETTLGRIFALSLAVLSYVAIVGVGVIMHYTIQLNVMIGLVYLVLLYIVGSYLSFCFVGLSLKEASIKKLK